MILDLARPHTPLDEGSDPRTAGADFIEQDGELFAWSESNVQYERAWWCYPGVRRSALVRNLLRERPIPKNWTPPT